MSGARRVCALLGLALLVAAGAGDRIQARQSGQTPTFRAGVNFVRVDVIPSDKRGALVTDLKPEDFEVVEQGRPQKIETFKLVLLDGGLMPGPEGPPHAIASDDDEAREAARDDVRLFGIFLDDYHVSRAASVQTRDIIARFIANDLGPSDMVGLMYPLEPLSSVLLTRNHDAVERGIEQFLGRRGEYDPKNPPEETAWEQSGGDPAILEQIRNQVSYSAVEGLVTHLGGFKEGRKTLILVTEGLAMGELNLRELYTEANRNNVSVYWVDPRMLGALSGPTALRTITLQQDALRTLSLYTDGRAIANRNDLAIAMKDIVRDSSGYYLLGYASTFNGADGKFHDISVHVKRSGVDVRARKGYWALNQEQLIAATSPPKPGPSAAVEHALNAAAAVAHARLVRTWLGTEGGENGKANVLFVWEPVSVIPGGAARDAVPAGMAVTASSVEGTPYFRGTVPAGRRLSFEAPPGVIELRLTVQGAGEEVLDSERREITIPDLTAPRVFLSTPQLFRARTARELQQIKTDAQAVPIAGREFDRGDRLLVRVAAYGPGNMPPALRARLLARSGDMMLELPVSSSSSPPRNEIELSLATLPPGDYLIEVTATGDAGQVQELVGFHVTG